MEKFIDYYNILGIKVNVPKQEIKKAYRERSKRYHPDAGGSNEAFLLLKKAFDTLYDDLERINYDKIYSTYKERKTNQEKEFKQDSSSRNTNQREESQGEAQPKNKNQYRHTNQSNPSPPPRGKKNIKIWRLVAIISIIINSLLLANLLSFNNQNKNSALLDKNINLEQQVSDTLSDFRKQGKKIDELKSKLTITERKEGPENNVETTTVYASKDNTEAAAADILPEDKTKTTTVNEPKDNSEAATVDILPEDKTKTTTVNEPKKEIVSNSNYFTLGSSKENVKKRMGTPDSIIEDDHWGYGLSSIDFDNGKVVGWNNISNNLKIKIRKINKNLTTFSLGSSYHDVVDVMGTPDTIIGDNYWGYGLSNINFDNGKVVGWNNISNNLKIN
ncbi:J domain-containing protein [Metabacillus sp. RGM 3146]|uniref:J domain-containing protein n=1 Tax=Metabacillus sp. RGM 3146 TaxID=3401092 RepID=UPI003B9D070F